MQMANDHPPITANMKIGTLLEAYPQLEEILTQLAPAFEKLKNPILRKTVAKVTSIRQAAKVGGISVGEMVNQLRQAAGQLPVEADPEELPKEDNSAILEEAPKGKLYKSFDARMMIESGEQPLGKALSELRKMPHGEVYELITPFKPAPLIDQAKTQGFKAISRREGKDIIKTYFKHADD